MNYICQYAIVRFLPYAETGEFANVGLVLHCSQMGELHFRMMSKVGRITAFFEELDVAVYRRARGELIDELARMAQVFREHLQRTEPEFAKNLFQELTRPREAMLRFDKPRVVMTQDVDRKFEELYDFYIGRNFVTREYQEKLIEKEIRGALRQANLIGRYRQQTVGNRRYHARFPFVRSEDGTPVAAIKPLHLGQDEPTQIYDHGWEWVGKIRKLRRENMLPARVLFAVQPPALGNQECGQVFREISDELLAQEVEVFDHRDVERILDFARPPA